MQLFLRNIWHNFPYVLHWNERWKNEKKMEKEGKNWSQHLDFLSHKILGRSQGVYKIWRHWLSQKPGNLWQKCLLERKKNGQIKGMISSRRLILSDTVQQGIPNICTKFQNPRFSSSWEIFDENKVYTQTHKHCYWKDKNYIPPIYFVYWAYNK